MDNICIQMPENTREFLMAVGMVQELQFQIIHGAKREPSPGGSRIRESDFTITIRLNEKYKYLEPCLQVAKDIIPVFDYSGWNENTRGEYNNYVEFNFELARNLAKANQLHITESLGAITGVWMNALTFGIWPSKQTLFNPLRLPKRRLEEKIRVNITEWDFDLQLGFKFRQFVENNYPELELHYTIPMKPLCTMETLLQTVNGYDVIVAPFSELTYIAASLEKGLIEIFHTEEDCYLYHNKNVPNYACTVGTPSAEYMWYMFEAIWPDLLEILYGTSSQSQLIPTEPHQFIANDVDERLSGNQDLLLEP